MRAGRALEQVFASVKLNFELLGNAVPHLHCHIKPRYYGDPAGGIPIWPDAYPHHLAPEEYEEREQRSTPRSRPKRRPGVQTQGPCLIDGGTHDASAGTGERASRPYERPPETSIRQASWRLIGYSGRID